MKKTMLTLAALSAAVVFAAEDPAKEFDDAVKAGEPLTAERVFKKLVKANPDTAPIRYFQAAEVARQLGQESLRRDRLAYYLRAEKGWNDNVEFAAWYLCNNGGTVEQFARLVKSVAADRALFRVGISLMERAAGSKRGAEIVKLAETMLPVFKDDAWRRSVFSRLAKARHDGIPGVDAAVVRQLLTIYPIKDFCGSDSPAWYISQSPNNYPADFVLECTVRAGSLPPPDMFAVASRFDSKDKDVLAKLAKLYKQVEPMMFKPGTERQSITFVEGLRHFAGLYFAAGQEAARGEYYCGVIERLFATCGKKFPQRDRIRDRVRDLSPLLSGVSASRLMKLFDEYPDYVHEDVFSSLCSVDALLVKAKSTAVLKTICDRHPGDAREIRWRFRGRIIEFGSAKEAFEVAEEHIAANTPGNIRCNDVFDIVVRAKATDDERIAFLNRIYKRFGGGWFMSWLKDNYTGLSRNNKFMQAEKTKAFIGSIDKNAKADFFIAAAREMCGLRRGQGNAAPDRAHALMKEIFAAYKGDYPQDGRPENMYVDRAISSYVWDLCRYNRKSGEIASGILLPKFGKQKKAPWGCLAATGWGDDAALGYKCVVARATIGGDFAAYSEYVLPEATDKLPPGCDLDKLSCEQFYRFINANIGSWRRQHGGARFKPALVGKTVSKFFQRFSAKDVYEPWLNDILESAVALNIGKDALADFPFDKIATELLDVPSSRVRACILTLDLAVVAGKGEQYLKRYLAAIEKLQPAERVYYLCALMCDRSVTPYKGEKTPDLYGLVVREHLIPAVKAIPNRKATIATFSDDMNWFNRWNEYFSMNETAAEEINKQAAADFYRESSRLLCAGARGYNWYSSRAWCYFGAYSRALKAGSQVDMVKYATAVGREANMINGNELINILTKSRDGGYYQPLFLMVNAMPGNLNEAVVTLAKRLRSEVATKLPGVYPVGEKDPAYPLYVAADELANKNSEAALKLLKANLSVFEREVLNLPPDFIGWAVDQLRILRGDKDAYLVKARQIAAQVIANESKVTPELAAAMLLVNAECYRDQQNFEAAKLEYQSIRNNPVYNKTPSGRKAMFRSVDLQIESGGGSQVEPTLEYWLSQPDAEIQAQAHYFLARIAFDRKDYDECIKQLREVFAIDLTHTEARFLQGQWKLATNSEIDETDVWIGSLSDRTAIRPGQQLSITVQDRNLSVAGGGASIPVIVRTDRGKDVERVQLYPSVRDPNLFKGMVDVRLGAASPSNSVLEVRGDDTVSYSVDPEFVKARGLPKSSAKLLRVVDDARLAIGVGAPRADEGDSEAQIAAMVGEGGGSAGAIVQSLRPGNSLYIAVADKDRSLGGKEDAVGVSVETTSGDRIDEVRLVETAPYSGVFRAVVPTALPPPRAFASDTAAGFNPGDVINSSRNGEWRSLSDGQPVKWFAVDTMGSHFVSNVSIKVAVPEDITALSLSGRLAGESVRIASLPAGDPSNRIGLRFQYEHTGAPRGIGQMRDYMDRAGAPKSAAITNFVYRPVAGNRDVFARIAGAFQTPDGYDTLRCRIVPDSDAADAFRSLTVWVSVDGDMVFTGRGQQMRNAVFATDMTPGVHFIEVFVTSSTNVRDSFRMLWEPYGETAREFPMDRFDAEKHPEIAEYVADKAVITRTADGFTAVFAKPVCLRTLRWDFTGRRSPGVTISSMTAVDADGVEFLPVASDFSDAKSNNTLEVAPGDRIVVKYIDDVTASGSKKIHEKSLNSSFTDGKIGIYFEESVTWGNHSRLEYFDAYRFIPGDSLTVIVNDSDLDVSDEADTVDVSVRCGDQEPRQLRLVEQRPENAEEGEGIHSGRFFGLIKTVGPDANVPSNRAGKVSSRLVVKASENDAIFVGYEDRENTRPGVPCVREASVHAVRPSTPRVTLFRTRNERSIDRSADAVVRLAAIRKRAGNEKVEHIYRNDFFAEPMTPEESATTSTIPVNVSAPILVRINDPSRARHAASSLVLEAVTERELARVEIEGGDPVKAVSVMRLGGDFGDVVLRHGYEKPRDARSAGSFNGYIALAVGNADQLLKNAKDDDSDAMKNVLSVNGNDIVRVTVRDGDDVLARRTFSFVSNASISLRDSTWSAERSAVHAGERFFVRVDDADRDTTDANDPVTVEVKSLVSGFGRKITLSESMPHSGVFNGTLRPVLFAPGETIPAVVTGGVASAESVISDDRFATRFGDRIVLSYRDERVLPGCDPQVLCVTGTVYRGSDGSVRLFSKRFQDSDQAVLVQFRLAECLFEQAKDFRKLKQAEKSAEAIAKGRGILEEALKNYPNSAHVMQGEFLLANLFQELAAEQHEQKNEEKARQLYTEALSRFTSLLSIWPEGDYAARAQYHKAYCLEMLEDYRHAAEEYVKMTYLYPESELVGDATIRLATHYYRREKRFDVSARIYENFQKRFPQHDKASRALFMCGSCYVKQAEAITARMKESERAYAARNQEVAAMYKKAAEAFGRIGEVYHTGASPELRAQALYWKGDAELKCGMADNAYRSLKQCVLDYPETEWARRARGLLLQEASQFDHIKE